AEAEEAVAWMGTGRPCTWAATERCFYHALTLAALYPAAGPDLWRAWDAKLEALQGALDGWAVRSPANFGHKALPVAAERARLAAPGPTPGGIDMAAEHMDLATVVKAIQAISSEIELGKLLDTLM